MNAYDDSTYPVELGASIFVSVNQNLVNAADELGLLIADSDVGARARSEESDILGVYDGKEILFTYPEGKWWSLGKLLYRYGPLAPWRTKKLTDSVVGKFLAMYQAPLFPFASLSDAVEAAGLLPAVGSTGLQFLEENGISGAFAQELIQASTRVNYGQNLGLIHGLETMVCMAAEGAMSIEGGNWRIFQGMVKKSKADLRLQTSVSSISRDDEGEWTVTSQSDGGKPVSEVYDEVILAGPLQFANLAITPKLEKTPDVVPYVSQYVTLFTSPLRLDPIFFGLKEGQLVPTAVLTTLNESERADPSVTQGRGKQAVGAAGFFSVSTLQTINRLIRNGDDEPPTFSREYLYKIFSPERFSAEKVNQLLGVPKDQKDAVTWVYRHMWKAYPYEYPRVTFEDIKLEEGLWYTAGIESFISTMETSSLMGMNVARLVVDKWEAEKAAEQANIEAEKAAVEAEKAAAEAAAKAADDAEAAAAQAAAAKATEEAAAAAILADETTAAAARENIIPNEL